MSELIFLGVGSAYQTNDYQTNLLYRRNNKNLLIDAGDDIRWSLKREKMYFGNIDAVTVTHGHGDHYHGMEYLGDCRKFSGMTKPKLFIEGQFADELWHGGLWESMKGLQGKRWEEDEITLNTYFDVERVKRNGSFVFEGVKFELVQNIHVVTKYAHCSSFGYIWTDPDLGKRILYTGDTQFSPESYMTALYDEVDFVIHDCETTPGRSGVHANYLDLRTLKESQRNKMVFVHYQFDPATEWEAWNKKAKDDGFIGFARPNDRFEEIIKHLL